MLKVLRSYLNASIVCPPLQAEENDIGAGAAGGGEDDAAVKAEGERACLPPGQALHFPPSDHFGVGYASVFCHKLVL